MVNIGLNTKICGRPMLLLHPNHPKINVMNGIMTLSDPIPYICSSSVAYALKNPRARSCPWPCRFRSSHAPVSSWRR
ncbi:hypothetical protein DEM27_22335 [Metarhizobium album]|uniref:Uncharacterized protein n=1 Tax=Metarhizobium album TaxID=2182425 RepID=A0A2U2DLB4_9HYPH|nr:hypothetical protein DEM27_22335 [Rhizobium album]